MFTLLNLDISGTMHMLFMMVKLMTSLFQHWFYQDCQKTNLSTSQSSFGSSFAPIQGNGHEVEMQLLAALDLMVFHESKINV